MNGVAGADVAEAKPCAAMPLAMPYSAMKKAGKE